MTSTVAMIDIEHEAKKAQTYGLEAAILTEKAPNTPHMMTTIPAQTPEAVLA